ncbi:DNA photolyase, FAD-binding/Cryptochrome [Vararia minispora EC-137]|uniref:DNA photolyase, FAD-binding/Cryptochrome n=1 Tax=Vararia minispora EC-137 TaxID=1314806 RepID=A0ACB8QYR5_9AGAM|nr:DNA photolyase, FAD-binding/Cryptochrome [Vararia minispora EC-137]
MPNHSKRALSPCIAQQTRNPSPTKKIRTGAQGQFKFNRRASDNVSAYIDLHPPLKDLETAQAARLTSPTKGNAVVYWMRMEDMRIHDNRALSKASELAKKENIPLVALFVISPHDYIAHDRGPRRIDFMLRNLRCIQTDLANLHIPLHVTTHTPRHTLPEYILSLMKDVGATQIFANIEYEVDELRRDIKLCELAKNEKFSAIFVHDKLIIQPDTLFTKANKPYTVYSPWQRNWLAMLNSDLAKYIGEAPGPSANDKSIHSNSKLSSLFDCKIPEKIDGFECQDGEVMAKIWPAGEDAAREMLRLFLFTKAQSSHIGVSDPLANAPEEQKGSKASRVLQYKDNRDKVDSNTTSRLSPYLASGVISARECVRGTLKVLGADKVQGTRDTAVGHWVQEVAWRDFYTHVMASFPRVSMGRTFLEKFDAVIWETNEEHFEAWKQGRTGVPIVDAAMRQLNTMGWMHNRPRMVAAMFLVKDLMIDWRLGERYFMEQLIDGDLASNNGGWQWSSSTGTDPQPYFRIMNPFNQSEKADPDGDYIRSFVPELRSVKSKDIHRPSTALAMKLNYPAPIIDHHKARDRAMRRFKNPGEN